MQQIHVQITSVPGNVKFQQHIVSLKTTHYSAIDDKTTRVLQYIMYNCNRKKNSSYSIKGWFISRFWKWPKAMKNWKGLQETDLSWLFGVVFVIWPSGSLFSTLLASWCRTVTLETDFSIHIASYRMMKKRHYQSSTNYWCRCTNIIFWITISM